MDWINLIMELVLKIPFILIAGVLMYHVGTKPVNQLNDRLNKLETDNVKLILLNGKLIDVIDPIIKVIDKGQKRREAQKAIDDAFTD